ncbi:rhodanese-like domain-containing protein [Roseovarius sp. D22-M7]|uniref:rhodanese-like domain-containing protein n=1 Tax=Roseovarius sp. D22-M7 TaxID=3127116 RepID=UPI00300F9A37
MTTDKTQTGTLENWTPQRLSAAFEAGDVAIIDVRTPQEYAFEHIRGALLAPLATFEPRHLPAQDGKRLVFHCGSGVRSRKVAEACLAAGMHPVAHLDGGFGAWKAAGLPYVTIDPATGSNKMVTPDKT